MPNRHQHRRAPRLRTATALALVAFALVALAGCTISQAVTTPDTSTPVAAAVDQQPTAAPTDEPSASPTLPASDTPTPPPTATPAPTHTPTPTEPFSATVTLAQPWVAQGHTGVVRVTSSRPAQVTGHLADQELRFVSEDGLEHLALVAIHALASTGTLPLSTDVTADDGTCVSLATTLEVTDGEYGEEYINFDAETSKLLDPDISEPENVLMGEVWATFSPDVLWQGPFQWPVKGTFTSLFGTRRSYGGRANSYHAGLDIDGETGDPVLAAANGVVVLAEPLQVRGNVVVLDHGAGVLSGYFHLDEILVSEGDEVAAGDHIGNMGATGLVTGSHLHWELHVAGVASQPAEWTDSALLFPAQANAE